MVSASVRRAALLFAFALQLCMPRAGGVEPACSAEECDGEVSSLLAHVTRVQGGAGKDESTAQVGNVAKECGRADGYPVGVLSNLSAGATYQDARDEFLRLCNITGHASVKCTDVADEVFELVQDFSVEFNESADSPLCNMLSHLVQYHYDWVKNKKAKAASALLSRRAAPAQAPCGVSIEISIGKKACAR